MGNFLEKMWRLIVAYIIAGTLFGVGVGVVWIYTHMPEPEPTMRCYQTVSKNDALVIYEDLLARRTDSVRFYFECGNGETIIRIGK